MACLVGYGAYRYEVVDHPVPVRVIGPDGRQSKQHSRACSWIWARETDKAKAKRWIRLHLDVLNVVHNAAANDNGDVAEDFIAGVWQCRDVQDRYMAALKIPSQAENDGSIWLKPPVRHYRRVADALIATGLVTHALTLDGQFGQQDPSKVNRAQSRTEGKAKVLTLTRRGLRTDVDNRLRLGSDPTVAPRFDDPRVFDRLKTGLAVTKAPQAFEHICQMGVSAGGRAMSILGLDLFDVFVLAEEPGHYPSRNKGDGPDERSFVMKPQNSVHEAILSWIAGRRAELSGETLDDLRQIAADPTRKAELVGKPLFTEDGVSFIKYHRLYRVFRRAAEAMDLYVHDEEYRRTGVKRFITFHLLRHEYVHRRLDVVDTLETPAAKETAKAAIIEYMKWKSRAMLAWYSKHHVVKNANTAADQFNKNQDEAIANTAAAPADVAANDVVSDLMVSALG